MQNFLLQLREKQNLSEEQAFACFEQIFDTDVAEQDIVELLTLLHQKEVVSSELLGFLNYLSTKSISCNLGASYTSNKAGIFDVCGTGGDGKNTINISTLSAFVLAAMGEKVAKHGNYSASSSVGSSNLLEALSVPLVDSEHKAQEIFDKTGLVFLHAPLWHPKLKKVAAIRRKLGFRTVFNLLGPLLNPVKPQFQLIGVSSLVTAHLICDVQSKRLGGSIGKFAVIADRNGYDEISLTGASTILMPNSEEEIGLSDFGVQAVNPENLKLPATLEETVVYAKRLLSGLGIPAHETVVAANVATALRIKYPEQSLKTLFERAQESVRSGKAMQILNSLRSFQ